MAEAADHGKAMPESEKKKEQSLPFYQLFSFADKYDYLLMISGSIGAVIHGSSMPVFFLLFGEMVNGFGKNQMDLHKMTHEVAKYALYFVYLGLVVCLSSYAEIACWMYTGERQVGALRRKYLEAVLKQDVGFFDTDARTGDIVFSVSTDTLLVQDAISEKVGNFIHYLSTFLAGLVVGFVSAWKLALLSVAVIPGIAFAGGLYAYTLTGLTSKSRESYASAGIIAEQSIAQVRTVYSYVGETKALSAYSDLIQNTLKLGYKAGMAKGLGLGCTYGIACMSWALVFWYAGVFIRNGQTDGGKAFTAIFSAIVGGMSLGQSFSNLGAFSKGKAAGYKLMEIIKQKPTIVQDASDGKCLSEVNGNIEFKNVTFSYPSRPDVVIFRDFSIFFPAGKTIAVVGGSGSGKSTVVSLIERFYDPNQGEILLDNVDIKTLQLNWLRNQIGLVNQEPALFATTILENILYGKPDATMTEVEAAASAANAHSFITLLPNGYNTQQLSLKGFAGDTAKAHAKTSMIAGEGVSNIRTVAAFNAQEKILSLFAHELHVPQRRSLRRSLCSGLLFGLSQLALYGSEALILWYGAHLVSVGASTFSKVIKVFVVLVVTANSVAETVSLAPEIVRGGEAVGSVFSILDRPTRIDPDDPEAEHVETIRGEIELRHVDFAYPSRPDVPVFKDFNLRIRAGQSQALVGASGSGKSSVIALIERFYDPIIGKVMIDGKDIRRLNLKSLRLKIGLVQQEPALFASSIFDNIAYGKEGATEAEVVEAARAANVHTFVSGLPDGYKTPVGERGVQLSGGQKQRIAIARAILKDPSILLLDEATSALDAESECVLQDALERLMRGRTTVVVAHRLSTIRGVDSIGVVQDGRIVEQGSHGDLISRPDGAYSRLLQLQRHRI
ncbi:UNVERIFIED_CONTAM: ABC transporter B family member 19 [Sesamum radiatum]|uniref:ABC transporter B family member 19 n=1 Tax=Sesamum radiatum TaxID=300843 RepID=A0AAW2V4P3_SESRA